MTVPATQNRNDYNGNATTAVYAYTFRITLVAQMRVILRDTVLNTADQVLTLNTDYTVSGVGTAGGNVTITNAALLNGSGFLATGKHLTLRRYLPLTQLLDIRDQGSYFPESIEDEFDLLMWTLQQQQDTIDRTLNFPESESHAGAPLTLPNLAARANTQLGFNNVGNPIPITATVPSAGVSSFWVTMLGYANAALSRAGLGFTGAGGTVATAQIDPSGLGAAAYAALSVATAAIANAAVTTAKIATQAITTALIADGNVTIAKMDPSVILNFTPPGVMWPYGGTAAPSGFLICDGAAVSRTTYSALFAVLGSGYGSGDGSTTFNLPDTKGAFLRGIANQANASGSGNANNSNATFTAHGFTHTGIRVRMASGTLGAISLSTNYWLIVVDANTLAFATTRANALTTTKIAISGANSAVIQQYEDADSTTRVAGAPGGNTGASVGTYQDEQFLAHTHAYGYGSDSNVAGGGAMSESTNAVDNSRTSLSTGGTETRPRNLAVNYIIKT